MMAAATTPRDGHVGDWVEVRGLHGHPSRSGEIVEALGCEGHEHYRVRWSERCESILYPDDGVTIMPGDLPGRARHRQASRRRHSLHVRGHMRRVQYNVWWEDGRESILHPDTAVTTQTGSVGLSPSHDALSVIGSPTKRALERLRRH